MWSLANGIPGGCSVAAFENATRMPAAKNVKSETYQPVIGRLDPRCCDDTRQPCDTDVPPGPWRLRKSSYYPAARWLGLRAALPQPRSPWFAHSMKQFESRRELGEARKRTKTRLPAFRSSYVGSLTRMTA